MFHVIAQYGYLNCISYLISIEKNYNTKIDWYKKDIRTGMTPLLKACNLNQPKTAIYLLNNIHKNDKLFDINDTAVNGETALWFACLKGDLSLMKTIFELFGDVVDVNKFPTRTGSSPLSLGTFSCIRIYIHIFSMFDIILIL